MSAGQRDIVACLARRRAPPHAVSVAGVLLLTEATMTEVPEPKVESSPLPTGDL
jgi:hypothetical protein